MIPAREERHIETGGEITEKAMAIAAGSEQFIFGILRKSLYSNPIGSLFREYTTNASDEHRKHGIFDIPIQITFPNVMAPELRIRDFAPGLPPELVFKFFGQYGASDKRESNEVVGMMGIGCKSAFAYTDSYVVNSYYKGICYSFNLYIDETEIGSVAKIGETESTEPSGIEVVIPVKQHDICTFKTEGLKTIKHFSTTPTIKGLSHVPVFEKRVPVIEGTDWQYFTGSSSERSIVLMGEIAYPINYDAMSHLETWEASLLRSDIHLHMPIGQVEVTGSREALQMSPKTIASIRRSLKVIKDEMVKKTAKGFLLCQNLVEAKALYYDSIMNSGSFGQILREAMPVIDWQGTQIKDNVIRLEKTPHIVLRYHKRSYRKQIEHDRVDKIECTGALKLWYDDTDKKVVGYKRRAVTLIATGVQTVLILSTDDPAAFEAETGLDPATLPSFKAVVPTFISNATGGNGPDAAKRSKHTKRVFQLDVNVKFVGSRRAANSDYWKPVNVELKNGLFVRIERFQPALKTIKTMDNLRRVITALSELGVKLTLPVYGLKSGESAGQLVSFDEWLDKKVAGIKSLQRDFALGTEYAGKRYNLYEIDIPSAPLTANSLASQYIGLYNEAKTLYNSPLHGHRGTLLTYSGVKPTEPKELEKLSEAFKTKYPMMQYVSEYQMRQDKNIIISYLNGVK